MAKTSRMLDDLVLPAGAGLAAGLGVAMPLGAVAALILRAGLAHGFRVAAAAAAGVAVVDTSYCALAAFTGAAARPVLEAHRGPFLCLSGLLVVAVGLRQLVGGRRRVLGSGAGPEMAPAAREMFLRFVALTAVNPLTLVYFVALAGAVTTTSASWGGPVVFVVAVGLASLAWQLLLALLGSAFGRSVGARTAGLVGDLASVLVVGLGAAVVLRGLAAG